MYQLLIFFVLLVWSVALLAKTGIFYFHNGFLSIGDGERECKKVLLCLDVDEIVAEEALDEAKVKEVIEAEGYTVLGVTTEEYKKKRFSLFGK